MRRIVEVSCGCRWYENDFREWCKYEPCDEHKRIDTLLEASKELEAVKCAS